MQQKLGAKTHVQNLLKVEDEQIMEGGKAFIEDLTALQEVPVIIFKEARVQSNILDATEVENLLSRFSVMVP